MAKILGKRVPPRITVYTAIFGDYDVLKPIEVQSAAEFLAFTDGDVEVDGWEILRKGKVAQPRRNARWYKCLPNICLSQDTDYSIWIDGNIKMLVSPERIINEWLKFQDIAAFIHPSRRCAYDEANTVIKKGKAEHDAVRKQVSCYKEEGFPRFVGLVETGIFVRRHTHQVKLFNFLWWNQINKHTERDQLGVNYCMWKLGIEHFIVQGRIRHHPWFSYVQHRR